MSISSSSKVNIYTVSSNSIGSELRAEWLRIWQGNPKIRSAFFHPEFTLVLGQTMRNVHVAVVVDRNETPLAFFPFHKTCREIGSALQICDFQGVISAPHFRFDARKLIKACGLRSLSFDHLLASDGVFFGFDEYREQSAAIDIGSGFDVYLSTISESGRRLFAKAATSERKVLKDLGQLRFEVDTSESDVMDAMHRWRAAKYGSVPVWVRDALNIFRDYRDTEFSGVLSSIYGGDKLLAAHFGIKSNGRLHWWFPAYNPTYANYGPGIQLLRKFLEQAGNAGVNWIDLGKGRQSYKERFGNVSIEVASGSVDRIGIETIPRIVSKKIRKAIRGNPRLLKISQSAKRVVGFVSMPDS